MTFGASIGERLGRPPYAVDTVFADRRLKTLVERQQGRCHFCRVPMRLTGPYAVTIDHLTPLSRGGADTLWNCAACCAACNGRKGPLTEKEFRLVRHDQQLVRELRTEVERTMSDAWREFRLNQSLEKPDVA